MVSTLVIFKEKIHNRKMNKSACHSDTAPRSSGSTPPSQVSHPDYASVSVTSHPASQVAAAKVAQVLLGVANNREHPSMKDLSQYEWYHGNIPRQKAENLLSKEGEFLVRDSLSQPGDFVLTVFWRGIPLHFVLNKQISETGVVEYQFEDRKFERPSELIVHHLREQRVITDMSGALISKPVRRTVPLEFYDGKAAPPDGQSPRASPWASPRASPHGSPRVQQKLGRRAGSQPLLSLDDGDYEPDAGGGGSRKASLPTGQSTAGHTSGSGLHHVRSSPRLQQKLAVHHRTGSEPSIFHSAGQQPQQQSGSLHANTNGHNNNNNGDHVADSDSGLSRNPPPKPSRIPTVRNRPGQQRPVVVIRNKDLYEDDGKDYTDYDQVKSWPSHLESRDRDAGVSSILRASGARWTAHGAYDVPRSQHRNALVMYDVPKPLDQRHDADSPSASVDEDPTEVTIAPFTLPDPDPKSTFDLSVYDSELLTPNNKPLEPSAVTTIKALLLDSEPKVMAQHLTSLDLDLLKVVGMHDLGLGVYSGLELITLPHGHVLRQDIIERYNCLSLFVALTILMCSKCPDRSLMLHQWIQTAGELRGKLGNLYGFSAVMAGLMSPQIKRLHQTWLSLCQTYPESAFLFEHRLSSLLSSLDSASAMLPLQDVTIPHIMPLVRLLETDLTDVPGRLIQNGPGVALDVVLTHLDTARIVTQQCGLYRMTAENVMRDFSQRRDLLDLFRTEMHLKLLWGWRGASVCASERLSKFPAVLDLLSDRVEPGPPRQGETSV